LIHNKHQHLMKKSIITFSITLLIVLTISCKTSKTAVLSQKSLSGTSWELSTLMGKEISSANYAKGIPDAVFGADGRVGGNGGCNRYSGSYSLNDDGKLAFGPMMATKMFCPGGGEEEYMKAIGQVNTAKISNGNLVLLNGTDELLVFKPKK